VCWRAACGGAGTLIDYYEDTYKLDTSFLGLINFFTGMLTVFATIGFGVLSDSSPWTRFGRRKPYVAMLTPILAISVGLLYSPRLVSNTAYIPVWFAITFMVSQVRVNGQHRPDQASPHLP
jgi:Na+/melibiose symporter-like transporter